MAQVDALKMVDHVRRRLVDLAVAENQVRDVGLSRATKSIWAGSGSEGGLVSDLWVEGAFPAKNSRDKLETLSSEGLFPTDLAQHLAQRGVFPADRILYSHQSESLRVAAAKSAKRPTIVISAGTGLGKTEAFLLPVLSDLWSAREKGSDGGMRCLILYPMNALVADQVARAYDWLTDQRRLTVFHFTSETPEDARAADKRGVQKWDLCRMRTRQEARGLENHDGEAISHIPLGNVPDIVITNYSMLEYMLCRPQDARFFGPDLRCIVLDEAHLYSGALAAEIAMLLRRVRERCGVQPNAVLQIATSATLGGDTNELRAFASQLFSSDSRTTHIIQGQYAERNLACIESPPLLTPTARLLSESVDCDLVTLTADETLVADDQKSVERLRGIVAPLIDGDCLTRAVAAEPTTPARFLHRILSQSPLARQLAEVLWENKGFVLSLDDLAKRLFIGQEIDDGRKATILLLRLVAAARTHAQDLPLIPHRLHVLVRAPEGLSLCLNPGCTGPQDRRIEHVGCLQEIGDKCIFCGHLLLPVHRCDNCGEWALAAHERQDDRALEPGYYAESAAQRTFYLLTRPRDRNLIEVVIDPQEGEIGGYGATGISLWKAPPAAKDPQSQECPTCASLWSVPAEKSQRSEWTRPCRALIGGRPYALSVTAETVLHDLPLFPDNSRNWKPAGGRRLLCFSDSRAAAARLGSLLTKQHETQVLRAAIARCVAELEPAAAVDYLTNEIYRLEEQIHTAGKDLRAHLELELQEKRRRLGQAQAGTSFIDFSTMVGRRQEIFEILDRDSAERHKAERYGQSDWENNRQAVRKHIEALLGAELARPLRKRASVESVGLIEVVYPQIQMIQMPPLLEERLPQIVRKALQSIWPDFLTLLLDTVRSDGCVSWSEETENRKWPEESPLLGRWLTRTRGGWNSTVFVGKTPGQLRRHFTARVLNQAGCSEQDAEVLSESVLRDVFDLFFHLADDWKERGWVECRKHHQTGPEDSDKAIRIVFDRLSFRIPAGLFRCEATGTLWPRAALGWAPIGGCTGTLRAVTIDEMKLDPRWGRTRREFLESPIFGIGLWGEEHSAQLSPEENRRLQDLFKLGARNVLSSTTTMELGIDIGGLNGVLLGNVPPSPANHRQRAGRAGRRSDGSAIVVTYARDTSYDREVFRRFGEFLSRNFRRPNVFMDRERIIRRHLYAVLLSEFLRSKQPIRVGAMQAFGKMGQFCGVTIPDRWVEGSPNKPEWRPVMGGTAKGFRQFLETLKTTGQVQSSVLSRLATGTPLERLATSDMWVHFLDDAISAFEHALNEWRTDIEQMRDAWNEIPGRASLNVGREKAKANAIRYQVFELCDITVIEWFANRRFLPRYGFPINLQRLTVRSAIESDRRQNSQPDERYRLERNSLLALSEYVPESRVLVGNRVAVSRGLRKHWTDSNVDRALGLQSCCLVCPEGHVYIRNSFKEHCPICDASPSRKYKLVFPRFGYTTAAWDPPRQEITPERIGEQSVCPIEFVEGNEGEPPTNNFAGMKGLRATYREEALLLVRNAGAFGCGFAICTRCGFSMSETVSGEGRMSLPNNFERHAPVFSSNSDSFCWQKGETEAPVLRNRVLAARERTDMILIEWPGSTSEDDNAIYSLGRALLLAGTRLLELDGRELGSEIIPLKGSSRGIVIYETSLGGTGHCLSLFNQGKPWMQLAKSILFVDADHNARCERACLDCILDFSGQYRSHQLHRRAALRLLDGVLQ